MTEMFEVPADSHAMRTALAAEICMLGWLVEHNALTTSGLQLAHWWATQDRQLTEATGLLYGQRQNLVDQLVHALCRATGIPASYWTDRAIVEIPDNVADFLGGETS